MTDNACPLPQDPTPDEGEAIGRMLSARHIAVVGLSDDHSRPSYDVSAYLQSQGYRIIPVNPRHNRVLGEPCYRLLSEVPEAIDLVLVFRRSEHCHEVTEQAIAAGTAGVWLQAGIRNEESRRLAREAGIDFIQDHCMMVEHMKRQRPPASAAEHD